MSKLVCYYGQRGSGKTLTMVSDALRDMEEGNNQVMNIHLAPRDVWKELACLDDETEAVFGCIGEDVSFQYITRDEFIKLAEDENVRRKFFGNAEEGDLEDPNYWIERARKITAESFDNSECKFTVCIDEIAMWADNRISFDKYVRALTYVIFQARKLDFNLRITAQLVRTFDVRIRELVDEYVECSRWYFPNGDLRGFKALHVFPGIGGIPSGLLLSEAMAVGRAYDTKEVVHPEMDAASEKEAKKQQAKVLAPPMPVARRV